MKMGSISIISGWVILFSVGLSLVHVHGFTQSEETALVTFRSRVLGTLPQEFMKSNAFLIRFLRLSKLNVGEAEAELKKYLDAREREGVDNITPEDVRGLAKLMPWRHDYGYDKQGSPIIYYQYGKAEFRKLALAGKSELVIKYILFNMEKILRKTIETAERTGKDIDSFYFIADIDGFNARNHLCASCFPITIRHIQVYTTTFGLFVKTCQVIDAPRIFSPVIAAIKQIVRAQIVDRIIIHDTDKESWKRALAKDIDLDQLPPKLGGTNTQLRL